jgi:hypothetical protein
MSISEQSAKPSKPTHLRVMGARTAGSHKDRDAYYTPPEAVHALLWVERFDGPIWEPACGNGAISRVLLHAGHEVISTDLALTGYGTPCTDFLMEWQARAPNIVTNPPFKLANQFAAHATSLASGKVAFLLRLVWLEGKARRRLFERSPLARVWVFSGRLPRMHREDYDGKKTSSAMAFAWFVWERGWSGAPHLGWLP